MPYLPCVICGTQFYAKPRHIKLGWGKYCSKPCQYKGQHTGKFVDCATCGKKVYRCPKDLKASDSKKYFCNKSCFASWKNKYSPLFVPGEAHFNWKHGKSAYRGIMLKSKARQVCNDCGIIDMRVLIVHHIDRNRHNNKIHNLKWLCRNCHYLEHGGKTV
ncbi:MAG: HNH endonuclease signature motif containing protein [bacterium]|nr:HNH endonuclease signature motif containing protein [bacterium]